MKRSRIWRFAAAFLVLVFMLGLLPLGSAAAGEIIDSGSCGDDLTWTLDSEGVLTISGTGAMASYSYDSPWYSMSEDVESVVIGQGVTSIGDWAFYNCDSLTSVTIPDSVTSIGDWAFSYCTGLTDVTIPDGVTSIGDYAFGSCTSLTSVTIPDSVTSIGERAFSGCSGLTGVTIPDSVTSLGGGAFDSCSQLQAISAAMANPAYRSVDGVLFSKDGKTLAAYPAGKSDSYFAIPDGVTSIGDYAFSYCSSLTSVTIPDGVTSIGDWAFSYCTGLTDVTIPDGVTSIGDSAFGSCTSLTSVTIPDSVTSIGDSAFYYCSSLTSVTIPGSVTSIGSRVFSFCSSLTGVTIPGSVTSIGRGVFSSCTSLTSVTIPGSVTSIEDFAFDGCTGLTGVTILDGVTSIGEWAFDDCASLTSVTIPGSVTSIDDSAFSGCTGLTDVYYGGSEAKWSQIQIGEENDDLLNAALHCSGGDIEPSPVTITQQPVSQAAASGDIVSYSVEATGENLRYQWQYWAGDGWANTGDDWNSSTSTMSFQAWPEGSGLCFRCVVWNGQNGEDWAFTDTVSLTVTPANPVTITRQPVSVAADSGAFVDFSLEATGKNLSYQWQYWDGNNWWNTGDDWNSGTDTMSFWTWDGGNGLSFRCVVWNAENGEDWAVSDTVTLTVTPSTAVTITRQPVSVAADSGAFVDFSLEAAGNNLSYQWQYWDGQNWWNTGDDWNSSTSTMSFRTWPGGNGLSFRCVVWNALNGEDWAVSDTVTLTVTAVTITKQPMSVYASDGSYVSYHVEATGNNLSYQWQYWDGQNWWNTGDDWNSGTDTMIFQTWPGGNGLSFRCVVWNALNGEDWAVSDTVSLTVF